MSLVPTVLEKEGNSERAMDLYSRLLKDRIIMVTGPIEPNMANIIKAQLLFLESEDPNSDIIMYIDSPGGEVATGMGIYDTMQYVKPDIRTICVGMAASMGSLILMGGTKGKRSALPNAEIMIHQPSGGAKGKATDVEANLEHLLKTKIKLHNIYAELTGQDIEKIKTDMEKDYWLTPLEAKEYGLIDTVLDKR
ncbi:ATP-dependent Clp protease proteolytic subunit [Megamonas rupellensis]|uniref:ATP-dependent Clp protease proteolytic subunit n=2 Tax=Megamonas TaxID=158846 RepID=A0A378NTG1_9FIRM|nr:MULTISPECIES: ATP-dependent Clp protease proteolytic subunit [Megamonas]RGQ08467.1 ATP-dependent Clp protease proteolytic subunit [Megamonas rupellensis]STY71156.1 ATP-dependent Clp protease proteolytic subunit [Megamonas hypermegale]